MSPSTSTFIREMSALHRRIETVFARHRELRREREAIRRAMFPPVEAEPLDLQEWRPGQSAPQHGDFS